MIKDNSATYGGGMYCDCDANPSELDSCVFSNNSASYGGGIYNIDDYGKLVLTNCVLERNTGGGMYNFIGKPKIINCTFSGNTSYGVYNYLLSRPTITNCIFWDNGTYEIYNSSLYYEASADISYSDIKGCGGSGGGWDSDLGKDLGGNIDSDPEFEKDQTIPAGDPEGADGVFMTIDDGLRLASDSPCIDAADGDFAPETDILGLGRLDIYNVDNGGIGVPDYADIGAYEYSEGPGIVVICWIDETENQAYYGDEDGEEGLDLYDDDLDDYETYVGGLTDISVKAGCFAPLHSSETFGTDKLFPKLSYTPPTDIIVQECVQGPSEEVLKEQFLSVRSGVEPLYILLSLDGTDSRIIGGYDIDMAEFEAFEAWIQLNYPDAVLKRRYFPNDEAGAERWLDEMKETLDNAINGDYD